MSYDIYIGNAVPVEMDEYGGRWAAPHDGVTVEGVELPGAPAFDGDDMSSHKNGRHPGYLQWDNFCRMVGLHNFFFHPSRGLMREHPGTFALESAHLSEVMAARHEWERWHPDATPRMGGTNADGALARLLWLEWWIAYALHNCERPAIHNH